LRQPTSEPLPAGSTGHKGQPWFDVVTERAAGALLLTLIAAADKVGIDVPLGWPDEFVRFVSAHQRGAPVSIVDRAVLRPRKTDRFVEAHTKRWPLSVSADRIAVPAMRAAQLLAALAERGEPADRSGSGRVVEVYPATALVVWNFKATGYKRQKGHAARCALLANLAAQTAGWLVLSPPVEAACQASDDVLDAIIASLVAPAAARGLSEPISPADRERAQREGWIALPIAGRLAGLAET
jgi:hypothetical protein